MEANFRRVFSEAELHQLHLEAASVQRIKYFGVETAMKVCHLPKLSQLQEPSNGRAELARWRARSSSLLCLALAECML